jgi:adenylosuccinate lyase
VIARYSRERMARLFSDEARFATWLSVELALVETLEHAGIAPRGTAVAIRRDATIDLARIAAIEAEVQHDVIAFLTAAGEHLGDEKRWLHYGLTSTDLVDTAQALTLRAAGEILLADVAELRAILRRLALRYHDTPAIGRTHGVHAEPTVFGLKPLLWYAELGRHDERLRAALARLAVGQMSGAVGTCAHLAPEWEADALARLGLAPAPVSTQVLQRDRHAEFVCALANLGGTLEKIATEIRHLQRTEVLEVEEPFAVGQKGSSAMPHKRNPVACERVAGLARLLRGYATTALEDIALWHERDISHSSVERVILPDACLVTDFMLAEMTRVLDGLVVYPERMQANLERTGGLIYSQRLLLLLVERGMSREEAYALVQRHALAAWAGEGRFIERIASDEAVRARAPREEIAALFDPAYYFRNVPAIYDRVLGPSWRDEAGAKYARAARGAGDGPASGAAHDSSTADVATTRADAPRDPARGPGARGATPSDASVLREQNRATRETSAADRAHAGETRNAALEQTAAEEIARVTGTAIVPGESTSTDRTVE